MRKGKLFALLLCIFLCGCTQTDQPENQAIAISLAIDAADNGGIELSVLLPSLHAPGQSSSSQYTVCSATAHSFAEAVGILRASVPLTLNFAQLKTVVFSQELAQSEILRDLVSDMFLTHRLYNAAYCIVSICPAKDMLKAMNDSVFGARLSSVLLTSMQNFTAEGGIPDTHFSDFYYDMHSIYGSPIAILGSTADGIHTTLTPQGRAGDALPGALPRDGGSANEYSGTALFRRSEMVGTLSSLETAWMNYLRGETLNIAYNCEGTSIVLSPSRPVRIDVDTQIHPMHIEIDAAFTVASHCSLDILISLIEADIASLIQKCQSLRVDPFLFSQRAAAAFPDITAWLNYDYLSRFPDAEIVVRISVSVTSD
ncbi:MAG: hypothetical protein IJB41_08495 [Clostridia bacterium]|nr:hypothetical protein [Clostridia bacterium]